MHDQGVLDRANEVVSQHTFDRSYSVFALILGCRYFRFLRYFQHVSRLAPVALFIYPPGTFRREFPLARFAGEIVLWTDPKNTHHEISLGLCNLSFILGVLISQ